MEELEIDFVPYQESLELDELGFDGPCIAFFNGRHHDWLIDDNNGLDCPIINPSKDIGKCIKRPTFSQAFRFFRKKYDLFSSEGYNRGLDNGKIPIIHSYSFRIINLRKFEDLYGDTFKTPEQAELECLKKLIEIAKNIKQQNGK